MVASTVISAAQSECLGPPVIFRVLGAKCLNWHAHIFRACDVHVIHRSCISHAATVRNSSMAESPASSGQSGVKRPRLQCVHCKETLSYSTYRIHQQTRSCVPVTRSRNQEPDSESSDDDFHLEGVDTDQNDFSMLENFRGDQEPLNPSGEPSSTEFAFSSSDESDDLAPEIWDSDSDTDSEAAGDIPPSHSVKGLNYVLSYFLLFFQLCYRLSDRGLQHIMSFISSLLLWLTTLFRGNDTLSQLSSQFPKTIYSLRKAFGIQSDLIRYCVCPTCHTLYKTEDCIIAGPGNSQIGRICDHIQFPNHPQRVHRSKCGTELMKTVKVGKKYKLVPRKLYVFSSITSSIKQLASRPGFFDSCNAWRNHSTVNDRDESYMHMTDVYDGKLWKDWNEYLKVPGNLLLMLNVDWFRPFKHVTYSIGVIYLVIQNLPRTVRFKPENIIIVGTIPGPHEPKLTINTYLKPMVDELLTLWNGVQIDTSNSIFGSRTIRVALCCISSDIPATRKLCGFYGFKAKFGCSKCMKEFATDSFSDSTDYSGFQRDQWPPRDIKIHRQKALESKNATTATARSQIEREIGVRYSELLRLPYLDIVRCHLVDPMHNLFLGTAKNVMSLWKSKCIIPISALKAIQDKMDSISVPARVGRLPGKIASGFSDFTAEQWMAWTIIYSPFVLKDFLPPDHFKMWCFFSLSCSLFCRPYLHRAELEEADKLMMKFCTTFERIFGPDCVTPNMHLHAHLRECIEDLGPVFSFWCFSFERYNGILENIQKNWHAPEVQIMEKFTLMQALNATDVSSSTPTELQQCLNGLKRNYALLDDSIRIFDNKSLFKYENNLFCLPQCVCTIKQTCHEIIPPVREKFFAELLRDKLQRVYMKLYTPDTVQHVPMRYEEFYQIVVFGQVFTSLKSRSHKSTAIMAIWPGVTGNILDRNCTSEDIRVGLVEYFVSHVPIIKDTRDQAHILAKVKWYQDHPRKNWFKNSIILSATLFSGDCEATFIPVSRIMSRCARTEQTLLFDYGSDKVNIFLPLVRRIMDQ